MPRIKLLYKYHQKYTIDKTVGVEADILRILDEDCNESGNRIIESVTAL